MDDATDRTPDVGFDVLRYADGTLELLDQTRLPGAETWVRCSTVDAAVEAIVSLRVRGAPLLGVAGAYAVAVGVRGGADLGDVAGVVSRARPTAVNLAARVGRVVRAAEGARDIVGAVEREADAIAGDERAACVAQGAHGATLVAAGSRVLTYCNTGTLATGGIGSALGVVRTAHARGLVAHVFVPETRPLLQGARLTAWELARDGIPHDVLADAATATLFGAGQIDAVFVGADRIAANGDVANKVGTYGLAVLAAHHGVPFHVVAPHSTVDAATPHGDAIPIEERPAGEVASYGGLATVPAGSSVRNPAFDVTPATLVTTIVTDRGVHRPPYRFV